MVKKINNRSGNSVGKFVLRTVAVVAVGAVLFFLAAPILNGISTFTAMVAGWMDGLVAQAAATWKIFAAWVIALAVLAALASLIISLVSKLIGKIGKRKVVVDFEEDEWWVRRRNLWGLGGCINHQSLFLLFWNKITLFGKTIIKFKFKEIVCK